MVRPRCTRRSQLIKILLLVSVARPAFAEELARPSDSYRLHLGLGANLLWGVAEEIVYKAPAGGTLLSLLLWPIKPLVTIGGELSLINDHDSRSLYLRFIVSSAPPMLTGTMEDFDWLSASSDYTHYSFHENHTERFFNIRLDLGPRLRARGDFFVIPYAGGTLYAAYWSARGGYTIYPPDYQLKPVEGTGISYSVQLLAMILGLRLEHKPAIGLSLAWVFELMPLVDVRAIDNHYLRDAIFEDYVYDSFGLSFGLDARIALVRWAWLGIETSFLTIGGGRGDTIHRSTINPDIQPPPVVGIYFDMAGFSMNLLSIGARLYIVLP